MDRLPLSCVRSFAVVARLLSITRAAEELSLTPSAVSHQIKTLEKYLGTALFHRSKNALRLTVAGERYMVGASEALLLLARATQAIKSKAQQQILRIGAPPTLAARWLVPRLGAFQKAHPDIALTVVASPDPPPLLQGALDVAFGYGDGVIPGLGIDPLGQNRWFAICRPSLMRGAEGLRTPADLKRHTLLDSTDEDYYRHHEIRQRGWSAWLQAAGLHDVAGARVMNLSPRILMHSAVKAGVGVGLSRSLLAVDALAAQDIAIPFGPAIPVTTTYNLVYPTALARRKDVAAFRDWVLAEAEASTRQVERMLKRYTVGQ